MAEVNLTQLLTQAGNRMADDLDKRILSHPGELGTEREEIIRSFLRAYLPKRFEVSTGFVFDCTGKLSEQIDIIIVDSLICPRFDTPGGKHFYPCECVVAVGQVKSSVTALSMLHDAFKNLRSVKSLDRSAEGTAFDRRYREPIDHRTNHLHQIFSFLFIIGRTLRVGTVREDMLNRISEYEPFLWPNAILALNEYMITYCCDDGVCPNPMHARGIAAIHKKEQDILLRFYLLLGRAIEVTRVSSLPYWSYLQARDDWDADVWYSTQDNPPPFLSSL